MSVQWTEEIKTIYVTLPPEMSWIATWSIFGYSQFPTGDAVSIWAFQLNQFLQSFLHQKIHFLHTETVYKCH